MAELVQLLTTFASRGQALDVARAAVAERVAACVQIVGPITSVYRWEGRVEEAEEVLCLFKTTGSGLEELVTFVRDHHPYDIPELTAVPVSFVDPRYLTWAEEVT